jgi:putative transposase
LRLEKILKELGINRSTYYRQLSRNFKDKDFDSYELIKEVFERRRKRVGIRSIKMILERNYKVIMNKKKIARIKKKYNLETQIRRRNKYQAFARKQHEHKVFKNELNRNFKIEKPDQVYTTDITQLNYGNGLKGYLAVFKDLCTKEIISQNVSTQMGMELTDEALKEAIVKLGGKKSLMIHSDQGFHFTHMSFRMKLEENNIKQSMSRKGNCLDNAPMESFFGLLKDHLDLKACKNIDEVRKLVTEEINYYNNERPQEGLKKMPPIEYRRHLSA